MLAVLISGSIIALATLATLAVGAFVGSQIDDRVDKPPVAFVPIKDEFPSFVRWPLLVGGLVLAVIIAKKAGKKILK